MVVARRRCQVAAAAVVVADSLLLLLLVLSLPAKRHHWDAPAPAPSPPAAAAGRGGGPVVVVPPVVPPVPLSAAAAPAALLGRQLLQLDLEQDDGVLSQRAEDEDDAGDDPGLDGRQSLGLGRVGLDGVEDVDQDQEDGHQQGHPTRYHLGVHLHLKKKFLASSTLLFFSLHSCRICKMAGLLKASLPRKKLFFSQSRLHFRNPRPLLSDPLPHLNASERNFAAFWGGRKKRIPNFLFFFVGKVKLARFEDASGPFLPCNVIVFGGSSVAITARLYSLRCGQNLGLLILRGGGRREKEKGGRLMWRKKLFLCVRVCVCDFFPGFSLLPRKVSKKTQVS